MMRAHNHLDCASSEGSETARNPRDATRVTFMSLSFRFLIYSGLILEWQVSPMVGFVGLCRGCHRAQVILVARRQQHNPGHTQVNSCSTSKNSHACVWKSRQTKADCLVGHGTTVGARHLWIDTKACIADPLIYIARVYVSLYA